MKIIINNSSMIPIYEQIVEQIKGMLKKGSLVEGDALPSVRTMAKELRISALTVKKAYDTLEEDGFTTTIHGKGTYVSRANKNLLAEEQRREVEEDLYHAVQKGRRYGLDKEEIKAAFDIALEDEDI